MPSSIAIIFLWSAMPTNVNDWVEYRVDQGTHDFKPNDAPTPYFGADIYTASFSFDPSCWWSIEDEDYSGGQDIHDWNKIGGMTNFFNANSKHSALLAWRPGKAANTIEVTAYINPKRGRFVTGPVVLVPVETRLDAQIRWSADGIRFEYGGEQFDYPLERPWAIRKVGPWFGGNQVAHKEMVLRMESVLE